MNYLVVAGNSRKTFSNREDGARRGGAVGLTAAPSAWDFTSISVAVIERGVKRLIRLSFVDNILFVGVDVSTIHIGLVRLPASQFRLLNFTLS
jgi:hypothetical protein